MLRLCYGKNVRNFERGICKNKTITLKWKKIVKKITDESITVGTRENINLLHSRL